MTNQDNLRLFAFTFPTPGCPLVPMGFCQIPQLQGSTRSWEPDREPPLPPTMPSPPGLQESGNPGARVRSRLSQANVGPSVCSAPRGGVTITPSTSLRPASQVMTAAAPSTFGVTIKNNPLTTTPRRQSGCAASTPRGCSSANYISQEPSRERAFSTTQVRNWFRVRCGSGRGRLDVGLRFPLGGLLGFPVWACGGAGEIINPGMQLSLLCGLGRFRCLGGWGKWWM